MDDLLAGFGKLLGTLQLGSIAEWTAGLVAFVALLIAVGTQRRQANDRRREEANSLLSEIHLRRITRPGYEVLICDVILTNDSHLSKRGIVLELAGNGLNPSDPNYAIPDPDETPIRGEGILLADDGGGIHYDHGLMGANSRLTLRIYTRVNLVRAFGLTFTDSGGRRWRRDLRSSELKLLR
ncbi:hypothetical protein MT356_09485 [Rathayibacter festucae]|uniref:hypothetical protein n=1 Tax=Rathayibacter festucae TaxID=110937 RepID=UPI001FB4DF11|nr:hypothetical protein [Rathayibacter festucae]MCJ1699954.1 hypothetical protein [Rathayibacter festucae]